MSHEPPELNEALSHVAINPNHRVSDFCIHPRLIVAVQFNGEVGPRPARVFTGNGAFIEYHPNATGIEEAGMPALKGEDYYRFAAPDGGYNPDYKAHVYKNGEPFIFWSGWDFVFDGLILGNSAWLMKFFDSSETVSIQEYSCETGGLISQNGFSQSGTGFRMTKTHRIVALNRRINLAGDLLYPAKINIYDSDWQKTTTIWTSDNENPQGVAINNDRAAYIKYEGSWANVHIYDLEGNHKTSFVAPEKFNDVIIMSNSNLYLSGHETGIIHRYAITKDEAGNKIYTKMDNFEIPDKFIQYMNFSVPAELEDC